MAPSLGWGCGGGVNPTGCILQGTAHPSSGHNPHPKGEMGLLQPEKKAFLENEKMAALTPTMTGNI